jgi:hypothetical protein
MSASEIVLGFLDTPRNSLVMKPEYTPSKLGGAPAWISPKSIPNLWCPHCEYKLTFLLQLYANIDEPEFASVHRMLYVFVCLSEKCINTQNAVCVFTAMVPHENQVGAQFKGDEDYKLIA